MWSCYEAGRDGFWLHRWLLAHGIHNLVVDSSSIEVKRRRRQAKTDRLDATALVTLLQRWMSGDRRTWSVIHVPSPEAEAARQLTRELATIREDRTRIRNRILGLLATQGIRCALTRRFPSQLATFETGDGRPLPEAFHARLRREWTHLEGIEARRTALRAERAARIRDGADRVREWRGPCVSCAASPSPVPRSTAQNCSGHAPFRMAGSSVRSPAWRRCRIAATSASPTTGSARRDAASCAASASNWRGAGCAGSRTVHWRSGSGTASPPPAAAVGASGSWRWRESW